MYSTLYSTEGNHFCTNSEKYITHDVDNTHLKDSDNIDNVLFCVWKCAIKKNKLATFKSNTWFIRKI